MAGCAPGPPRAAAVVPAATATPAAATAPPGGALASLVPIAPFTSARDDVRLADLTDVLAPASWADAVRSLLPRARVTEVQDVAVLAKVRASRDAIALVPPEMVDASVRTLSVDGRFYWDRSLDLTAYPLRVASDRSSDVERAGLWELVAAGEIIFGRGVEERIEDRDGGDARAAFSGVRGVLRAADLSLATLEAPVSGNANRWCDHCMTFVGNERYVAAVGDAGIGVVALAANHIGDAGAKGIADTIRALDAAGIAHAGAGADAEAARRPAIVSAGGLRIAVLAYTDVPPEEYWATASRAGSAPLVHDAAGYAALASDIRAARALADVVVVMPHWGIEYEDHPRPDEVAAAHAMVDAGADVVVGDHPHWVQSVEIYRGHYVAYGVGNFVFDQMWSPETREGSLQRLFFSGTTLVSVRILPTLIEDYYRPRLLAPSEPAYRDTLERIWKHSTF